MPPVLLPENFETWKIWCLVQTQWRVGMCLVGLDYKALKMVAKIHSIKLTKELFSDIQALEMDTLLEQQEKSKRMK